MMIACFIQIQHMQVVTLNNQNTIYMSEEERWKRKIREKKGCCII